MYYGRYQRELADNIRRHRVAPTAEAVRAQLHEYLAEIEVGIEGTRPHHRLVQRLVIESALEPARLEAWLVDVTQRAAPPDAANYIASPAISVTRRYRCRSFGIQRAYTIA
jgi:hypothetical protein